jgi:hypothetical protein
MNSNQLTDKEQFMQEQEKLGLVLIEIDSTFAPTPEIKGKTLKVLFGSRWEKHTRQKFEAYVRDPDTGLDYIVRLPLHGKIVQGKYQQIYFPIAPFAGGSSSMMGRISKGLRSGKVFRGR